MAITCNVCQGTGFINWPDDIDFRDFDNADILTWMDVRGHEYPDFQVCSCCGNGEDWYGVPGEHYNSSDPQGREGPYAYNGGLCECH